MTSLTFKKYGGKTLKQMRKDYPEVVLRYKEYLYEFNVEDLDVRIQHKTCNAKYDDWMLDLEKERYEKAIKEDRFNKQLRAISENQEDSQKSKVEFVKNEHGLMLPKITSIKADDNIGDIFRYSDDFCSIYFKGENFTLTNEQAKIIMVLYLAYKNKTPSVTIKHVMESLGKKTGKHQDIFRSNKKAYKALVTQGERKGTLKLNI
jgi:sulfur relay (sulfurtransferase) DsrC/TusE family protein